MNPFKRDLNNVYTDIRPFALKLSRYNEDDAMDLIQKTFLKALEKQDSFKGGNFTGWIVTIMKNTAYDENRKMKGKYFVDIDDEIIKSNDSDEYVERAAAALEKWTDTTRALEKLGEKCRSILMLIAKEYKYAEVSTQLAIPIGTVMSRLYKCRKELHKKLYG